MLVANKKKSFLMKLLKFVGRGNQVQSSKSCLAQIYEQRKKQRQRKRTKIRMKNEDVDDVCCHFQIVNQLAVLTHRANADDSGGGRILGGSRVPLNNSR
ncbi:hypothetical protein B9Z55_020087 [Caenorhabditis nigoni]|uniref:Uncharacterized protein n=1 Tax=Caenorhabditis nigoni TaxID=1611254 RepID=A0A2G5TLQ5_9PELO|nr:hypothetical protein B9Z55_020087 [Caenorhabditis nigoni]